MMVSSISNTSNSISSVAAVAVALTHCASLVVGSIGYSPEQEAKALLESGWWSFEYLYSTTTTHCNSPGVTCNHAGRVTHISLHDHPQYGSKLGRFLNGSSFPNLVHLDLAASQLFGSILSEIGTLSKLTHLNLSYNYLSGELPLSLRNLSQMVVLDISFNHINGSILPELGNLNTLVALKLSSNSLYGPIPSSLGLLTNLTHLDISANLIYGRLPHSITTFTHLMEFDTSYNAINGSIPIHIEALVNLVDLKLSANMFKGPLPPEIGNLMSLETLGLGDNQLTGVIPFALFDLTSLQFLSLSRNQLSGSLPSRTGNLKKLISLKLSSNNLLGPIAPPLGSLKNLQYIDLSNNHFNGSISTEICYLSRLTFLDLSNNSIVGEIPSQLANLTSFTVLNLTNNHFNRSIPCSIMNNDRITLDVDEYLYDLPCFRVTKLYGNTGVTNKVRLIIVSICVILASLFLVLIIWAMFYNCWCKNKTCKSLDETIATKNGDIFSIWNYDGNLAYKDIIQATEDFNIRYCIGTGGYGSVYRAQLPNGKVVTLKKLHTSEMEELALRKSFENEVKTLTELKHRNIVRLYGFCLHKRCMFLIYQYMERGSLFCVLNNDVEAMELDWKKRVNIIKGIVNALCYMHNDCTPQIVHRDVTTNNVLINSELEAVVADFGTAKLLNPNSTTQSTILAGTYGYIAPGKALAILFLYSFLSDIQSLNCQK